MIQLRITLLAVGASRNIEPNQISQKAFKSILELFTRKELHELAKKKDIPRGRNKGCTIDNLITFMHKLQEEKT